jgi:arginine utilization protein RocB
MNQLGIKIKELAVELTRIRSIVGTKGEVDIAEAIYDYLQRLEYFRNHPEDLKVVPIPGDALDRKNIVALVHSQPQKSDKSVLCLGHIDTVGIEDYAELKAIANQPEIIKEKLKAIRFNEETRAQINSEEWVFGRGIFDMKTGVAALLVMIEEFSKKAEQLDANLIFAAVPDEEGNSAGMLAVVEELAQMVKVSKMDFIAAVDTDYMTDRFPGDNNKYVYLGTVGKLLPCFYLYGEETHVGEAFNGLDANLLASEVLYQMDLNTDLCDVVDKEVTVPPVSLHQRDLKTEYSVQTANAVSLYFNYATYSSQPDEVLAKCKQKAVDSFANVIKRLNEEYEKYCMLSNIEYKKLPWEVQVMTYEELYREVRKEIGGKIDEIIQNLVRDLQGKKMDDREVSLAIVQEVHKYYSDQNSKIIVYFAPPYYPHIFIENRDEKDRNLLAAVQEAVAAARKQYHYSIEMKRFYPYISDLSYCSISKDEKSVGKLTGNMPAWGLKYQLPVAAIQQISMPVVNIGPYGKDAHKLSERVSTAYSFDAMPFILYRTLENILTKTK